MKKSIIKVGALATASLLALAACAQPPSATTSESPKASGSATASESAGTSGAKSDFKACMVSDAGGFDDKSFNETSHKGLLRAEKELGIKIGQIESHAAGDFAGNIKSQIDDGCNIIVTVGFLLAEATQEAAKTHPDVDFAIVDYASFEGVNNAKGLLFNTAQPAFLAGYTAAAMTKSGKVGTFGGTSIPTVNIFMEGFDQGVKHYNETKGADVQVVGWNRDGGDNKGQYIGGQDPFGDIPGGKNTAATLISQGADIIMPVAGPAGIGALQAAKESGGKVNAVWVDTDGYVSTGGDYGSVIITSVEKAMDVAVFEAIKASKEDKFDSKAYVGTLENGGVKISPFHDFESKLPESLTKELDEITKKIISGEIKINSESQPE
ncbi:BMP family protein [Tessaracoccus sp. OH4464_COT-324]|uniref:BMP family lipoprotein n=1 Tax=Tessaracoccus sp. OH4464_COT-324 TaxID=2491059 RepID=UPI000F63C2A6|nr:BMP family ABC transporter substrate-binding protein [Tessaracoccus sp. OH4464_COT-324]RRD46663.1 BMP family ABC transporter substrate-binding protein [Tessaracoccus sp. OH4464_COT-324]